MKKNNMIIAITLIALLGGLTFLIFSNSEEDNKDNNKTENSSQTNNSNNANSESDGIGLLDGFPEDQIDLYKSTNIESIKFFVNDDPQNYESYFGSKYNYYNVVFETEASQSELLEYYQSKMDTVNEENYGSSSAEGKIGKYGVSASHYGESSKTAYLQVYLPQSEFSKTNPFFSNYPELVEIDPNWTEHESSYGKLDQLGGQIEYTQYFTVNKDDMDEYLQDYTEKYADKEGFKDAGSGYLSWKDGEYSINLTFSKDHSRVYLMIRKSM